VGLSLFYWEGSFWVLAVHWCCYSLEQVENPTFPTFEKFDACLQLYESLTSAFFASSNFSSVLSFLNEMDSSEIFDFALTHKNTNEGQ